MHGIKKQNSVNMEMKKRIALHNWYRSVERRLQRGLGFGKKEPFSSFCFMKRLPKITYTQSLMLELMKMDSFLILRFGLYEYQLCYQFLEKCNGLRTNYSSFLKEHITMDAGLIGHDDTALDRYAKYVIGNLQEADVLAYWRNYPEKLIFSRFYNASVKHINVEDLYPFPFFHKYGKPVWQRSLKDKNVMVVTSFPETVRKQYENRKYIWDDADEILPPFHLIVYPAVCTNGGFTDSRFCDWEEAVDYMVEEILQYDFDIALISCGGYGLPLAIRLKKAGRRVVQWGGCYQLWFGILGGRWVSDPEIAAYRNDYWVFPQESETPPYADKVNNYSYWKPEDRREIHEKSMDPMKKQM